MNKFIKKYLTVVLAALFIFGFSIFGIITPDKDVSSSERRTLASFPKITADNFFSGKFMTDFETYSLEQFPLRDSFRSIKANAVYNGFLMKDNNGVFIRDGYIFKNDYPYNESSVSRAVQIFRNIHDTFLNDNNNVYISVIPDKNYFLDSNKNRLVIDYEELFQKIKNDAQFAKHIDITSLLSIDDYYKTDTHWRQEKITDVADILLSSMNAESSERNYVINTSNAPFYGVYYGQAAVKADSDILCYLTDSVTENAKVYDKESEKYIPVYNMDKLNSTDPYEIFLSGSKSLLTIENPNSNNQKELIIFRDSFGSSIAPLLIDGYRKIALVDIRYLPSMSLGQYIEFTDQDVLFLYSTSVLNNSITLK